MLRLDRRFDNRIPFETYLSTYVMDRPQRAVTVDISETGLLLHTLPRDPLLPGTPIGLELKLPGVRDVIWAAGEACRDVHDGYFSGIGVRFTAMARAHARLVNEYCFRLRRQRLYGVRGVVSLS